MRKDSYISLFQSTHSMRSATTASLFHLPWTLYFNPRTPCGVRPVSAYNQNLSQQFQSTHSMRSATQTEPILTLRDLISIHALHAECDQRIRSIRKRNVYFNPRTPCGVRLKSDTNTDTKKKFQSTHSMRSATPYRRICPNGWWNFNPRTPCGVRRKDRYSPTQYQEISIHALHAECDANTEKIRWQTSYFNPRTPCGVRPLCARRSITNRYFNPRTPCGVRHGR